MIQAIKYDSKLPAQHQLLMTDHIHVLVDSAAFLHASHDQCALCSNSHIYRYKVILNTNHCQNHQMWLQLIASSQK